MVYAAIEVVIIFSGFYEVVGKMKKRVGFAIEVPVVSRSALVATPTPPFIGPSITVSIALIVRCCGPVPMMHK
jgi:hypothetical protein